jgi:hypothetical protein
MMFTTPGTGHDRTGDGFSLGVQFVVLAPNLSVVSLGFYDTTGGALKTDHEIGLWDVTAGHIQVADATVTAGTSNGGVAGFLFVALTTPVALIQGDTYTLAAYFPAGDSASTDHLLDCCDGTAPAVNPDFNPLHGEFTPSNVIGHLSEPTGIAGHAYIGPNLEFNTPEPGTGLLMIGALGLWLGRRRRTN